MTLEQNIDNALTRIATEFKRTNGKIGSLASLSTTDKTSLVNALNELKTGLLAVINDNQQTATATYSANKIVQLIAAAKSEIIGGADSLHDTLKEIQDLILADESGLASFNTALGNRLRVDAAQSLNSQQKATGLANLGAVAASDIGDTNANFVAVFEAGLQ